MARRISSPVLIGREEELRAFERAMEETAERHPSLFVIGGEAGVGKSRLVHEFAARTRAMGGVAAVGTATPPAGSVHVPLVAVAQALRALVRAIDVRLLDHVLGPARGDLAALLPELGPPSDTAVAPQFAAARLAEAVLVAVDAVAAKRPPLLFALEDLHWLDDATRAIVLHVCLNLVDAPVVIVLTYRSDHPREADGVLDVLAALAGARNLERLDLAPLDSTAVAEQIHAIVGGDVPESRVRDIVRRSGGIPFFVEELVLQSAEGRAEGPPPSIRAVVDARVTRLEPSARAVVEVLAVAGGPMRLDVLAEAAGVPWADLPAALDEAAGTYLVTSISTPRDAGPGSADIRHVLLREGLLRSLSDARRRELHGRVGSALEHRPQGAGANDLERASTLAKHWRMAGDDAKALPLLLREAAGAEQAYAFGVSAQAYLDALEVWDGVASSPGATARDADVPDRAEVLEHAANVASLAGRPEVAVVLTQQALRTEPSAGAPLDSERTSRLTMHLGRFHAEAGQIPAALAALGSVVGRRDAGPLLRARALTSLSRLLVSLGRAPEAVERAEQAVTMAGKLGMNRELAQAQTSRAAALAGMGRMDDALEAIQAAAFAAGTTGSPSWPSRPSRIIADLHGYLDRTGVLERAGDLAGAARMAEQGMRAAEARGLGATQGTVFAATAARDLLRAGDWDEADRLMGQVGEVEGERAVPEARLVLAHMAALRGGWERAETHLAGLRAGLEVSSERGWVAYAALVAAEAACWRRRFLEARAAISEGIESATAESEHDTLIDLALLGIRVEGDALAAGARRRQGIASATRELATEYWIRLRATVSDDPTTSTLRERAILASAAADLARMKAWHGQAGAQGAWPGAAAAWDRAVRAWDAAGHAYQAAYCRWRLAESLVMGRLDREAARLALQDSVIQAGRLAAEPLAREAEALARRARLIQLSPPPVARGPDALTPQSRARAIGLSDRETEVLALIAEGLSDREIGERLFITTKTTGHHVSHILAKLGLDRRGEAAALAFRLGLVERPT